MDITFITGNQNKAELLAKSMNYPIKHKKIELLEPQSLELKEITEHKVRQAYRELGTPLLVEDISFSLEALGKLPGPFIKWFIEELGFEAICRLADATTSRRATTGVCYAYFDGKILKFFEGQLQGTIPDHPRGDDGFGWNCIFIPDGQLKTNAEMNDEQMAKNSLREATVYPEIRKFLATF